MKQNEQKLVEYQAKKIERMNNLLQAERQKSAALDQEIKGLNAMVEYQNKRYDLLYDWFMQMRRDAQILNTYLCEAIDGGYKPDPENGADNVGLILMIQHEIEASAEAITTVATIKYDNKKSNSNQ